MKRIATAATLLLIATSAFAQQDAVVTGEEVIAESDVLVTPSQWRLAAGVAFSDYDGDTTGVDDSTVGFKMSAQYQFNEWLGIEGAYLNTSDFEANQSAGQTGGDRKVSYTGFTIAGVGYLPLNVEDIDIYGLVGFFDFDTDLSSDSIIQSSGHTDGAYIGGGATLSIAENFGIRAQFDWYDTDDADLWSVFTGLEYRFK
jgi:hypothetical protein